MRQNGVRPTMRGASVFCLLMAVTACSTTVREEEPITVDPDRMAFAMEEVDALQDRGARVWCVPFARNLSGIGIHGDAHTWWGQAKRDVYGVTHTPVVNAVMSFKATSSMPLGHVAVVSEVISDRKILVDHANWHRNQVSLGMAVIDTSKDNDWSRVRLESFPGAFGSVYPVNGFITPAPEKVEEAKAVQGAG